MKLDIPGFKVLELTKLVLDYNGTLAKDGETINGVTSRLSELSRQFEIHVVTGDVYGKARNELAGIECQLTILPKENQAAAKLKHLEAIGPECTVAIGNGRNDALMLKKAAIGVVVNGEEGTAIEAINAADIFLPNILDALDLFQTPLRLVSSLRS